MNKLFELSHSFAKTGIRPEGIEFDLAKKGFVTNTKRSKQIFAWKTARSRGAQDTERERARLKSHEIFAWGRDVVFKVSRSADVQVKTVEVKTPSAHELATKIFNMAVKKPFGPQAEKERYYRKGTVSFTKESLRGSGYVNLPELGRTNMNEEELLSIYHMLVDKELSGDLHGFEKLQLRWVEEQLAQLDEADLSKLQEHDRQLQSSEMTALRELNEKIERLLQNKR